MGDVKNEKGELWELQFKGAGKTPYSRHADGRAVLRSSIREYLGSQFMQSLGVRTTLALSLAVSTDTIDRDPKYDGNVIKEKCAVVLRMANNFIRFGSFQLELKQHSEPFDEALIPELYHHTIENYFPEIFE